MKQVLTNVKLSPTQNESELIALAQRKLHGKCGYFRILRKSLDARDKRDIHYIYTIEFSAEKQEEKIFELPVLPPDRRPEKPVVVVGGGPAGLFCALRLTEREIPVILIERGAPVDERDAAIRRFVSERKLDENSNVQFGEGGAGTFSDGKLNTQTHSPFNREVPEIFARFGAPEEILWLNKPHIGSDKLKGVVKNMREYILSRGGKVSFYTALTDLIVANGAVSSVRVRERKGAETVLDASAVVLAVGHSARDTFSMLYDRGVAIRQKDFAVGVRIEHLQKDIDLSQYGKSAAFLPAADYKLVSHVSDRAAFTFCMCPGGYVMSAASEEGGVVTNGMSYFARDGVNANSALIASVSGADFGSDEPLAGVEFQRRLERAAFEAGGRTYAAPVQLVGDFLRGRESRKFGKVSPTYAAGTVFADLGGILPDGVAQALKGAIVDMDKRLKGFACPEALLTGVETRTSSPVRILRGEDLQSESVGGLYPCGEGAGYSGGITSSAADGLRVAEAIYRRFLG